MNFMGENNWKLRITNGNCGEKILSEVRTNSKRNRAIARFSRRTKGLRTYNSRMAIVRNNLVLSINRSNTR